MLIVRSHWNSQGKTKVHADSRVHDLMEKRQSRLGKKKQQMKQWQNKQWYHLVCLLLLIFITPISASSFLLAVFTTVEWGNEGSQLPETSWDQIYVLMLYCTAGRRANPICQCFLVRFGSFLSCLCIWGMKLYIIILYIFFKNLF